MLKKSRAKIRVMVVEDHVLVRVGLACTVNAEDDMEIVAEAGDGRCAIDICRECKPDVIIMDVRLPGMDGVELMRALRREFSTVKYLFLSSYEGGDEINRVMQSGAAGYVSKSMGTASLLEGIRTVYAGGRYLLREIAERMTWRLDSQLSERELQVLRAIVKGMSNKQIGSALGIVESTAKAHVTSILSKLHAADRAHAVAIAIKRRIVPVE